MKCQNKFISGRGNFKLIITKQGSQGMGVKLSQNDRIDENIFIGEYTGQVRSRSAVEKNSSYSAKLSKNHVVDAKDSTNILKYLNHSCFPNARLEVWLSEGKLFMSIFYMKIKLTIHAYVLFYMKIHAYCRWISQNMFVFNKNYICE
jgi:hypothetical protein